MADCRDYLTRSCSFDSTFEQILPPEQWKIYLSDDSDIKRGPKLDRATFEGFLDDDGRLVEVQSFRQAVFRGGIESDVRQDAWAFLYGLYPFQSTRRERKVLSMEYHYRYEALKARWKALLALTTPPNDVTANGAEEVHLSRKSSESLHNIHEKSDVSDCRCGETDLHNRNSTQNGPETKEDQRLQMECMELQARIYAEREPLDIDNMDAFKKSIRIIDKDVPRTDRDHPKFKGPNNPNLPRLRNILITFAVFHPQVTYAQGMNDVLSRFFVVMDSEVESYWCFTLYLETIYKDFLEDGMLHKLGILTQMLQEIDPFLYDHLTSCEIGDLMFCHRWLLLCFKREFQYEESLMLFEIISSKHLEVSSVVAERARDIARARDFLKAGGRQRVHAEVVRTDFTFELFVCTTILYDNRQALLGCIDSATVFQYVVNGLSFNLDLQHILCLAEKMLLAYCRRTAVKDSFELLEHDEAFSTHS
ncbi:TBC1 domain family member 15-like [Patiria miniata]|uniref:Rab-GAP TBC domain-containing protein n=1 Tax=Patiria miniata TaxID=46514 RepID=A0A913ZUZ6_PATMI|nr:TBC1 domain family member 15-like [Patiria miniata]